MINKRKNKKHSDVVVVGRSRNWKNRSSSERNSQIL